MCLKLTLPSLQYNSLIKLPQVEKVNEVKEEIFLLIRLIWCTINLFGI